MISVPHTENEIFFIKILTEISSTHTVCIACRGAEYEITILLFHFFFSTPKQTIHVLRQFSSVLI